MAPSIAVPLSLVVGVSSVAGLYYVEKQNKAHKTMSEVEPENSRLADRMEKGKKYRLGLMAVALLSCLVLIYSLIKEKKATSSFENRVTDAAKRLRSSMEHVEPSSSFGPSDVTGTPDDFADRVSLAAKKLREQITQHQIDGPETSDLAAKASAEISQFIADNS